MYSWPLNNTGFGGTSPSAEENPHITLTLQSALHIHGFNQPWSKNSISLCGEESVEGNWQLGMQKYCFPFCFGWIWRCETQEYKGWLYLPKKKNKQTNKNWCVSGPIQLKPILFKGQLYTFFEERDDTSVISLDGWVPSLPVNKKLVYFELIEPLK